jgi:hypothetical protein
MDGFVGKDGKTGNVRERGIIREEEPFVTGDF